MHGADEMRHPEPTGLGMAPLSPEEDEEPCRQSSLLNSVIEQLFKRMERLTAVSNQLEFAVELSG